MKPNPEAEPTTRVPMIERGPEVPELREPTLSQPSRTDGFFVNSPDHRAENVDVSLEAVNLLQRFSTLATRASETSITGLEKSAPNATITTGQGPKAVAPEYQTPTRTDAEKAKSRETRKEMLAQGIAKWLLESGIRGFKLIYEMNQLSYPQDDVEALKQTLERPAPLAFGFTRAEALNFGIERTASRFGENPDTTEQEKAINARKLFQMEVLNKAEVLVNEGLKKAGFSDFKVSSGTGWSAVKTTYDITGHIPKQINPSGEIVLELSMQKKR